MKLLLFIGIMMAQASAEAPSFTLVNSDGNAIHEGELGLLLYNSGTVCDDRFDVNAANAICRFMGDTGAKSWTSGSKFDIQTNYEIKMDDVDCRQGEWGSCSFTKFHNCEHYEDVFLSCEAPSSDTCANVMASAGIDNNNFEAFVSHSIHSLTLDDIRFYFKSDATEDNNIPTVNADMESEERVLPNAPLIGYDEEFSTPAMRQFDMVLRNMNRADWQVKGYSPLEKVAHVFHMAELWNKAGEQYDVAERLLSPDSELCGCLRDVENNGIWQNLNLMALKIRYPGITSGNSTITDRYLKPKDKTARRPKLTYRLRYGLSYSLRYGLGISFSSRAEQLAAHQRLAEFDFSRSDLELLRDVAEQLEDGSGVMEHELDSAEHWEYWKTEMKTAMRDDLYYDLGVFMFCMLN